MKLRNILCFIVLGLLGQTLVQAQSYMVKTTIDSASINVGDPVHLKFEISAPKDVQIRIPVCGENLSKNFDILKKIQIDSSDITKRTWKMEVTSYDSGTHVIPSLPFVFVSGNKSDTLFSDSLKVNVSLLPVDSTKIIADIKQPVSVPLTFKEIAPYLFGGLGVIIILIFVIWLVYRLRSKKSLIPNFKKAEPAHVRALRDLQKLKDEKLWQKGNTKEYYTRMSDIVRLYLEERFAIQAMEQTTFEIVTAVEALSDVAGFKHDVFEILEMSDLAKFAKMQPNDNENTKCYDLAVSFIENTALKAEVVDSKEDINLNKQK